MPIYKVQFGDTLFAIAWNFGTSVGAIQHANDISNPNVIFEGQMLCVPSSPDVPPDMQAYTVQAGDTLTSVAEAFGTTVDAIVEANGTLDTDFIEVGQFLCVPVGQVSQPPSDSPRLDQIQGNILGGFNKDRQTFLFLNFPSQDIGRSWLAKAAKDVATSEEVIAFNQLFKAIRRRRGAEGTVQATWMNLAFSFSGLQVLGVSDTDLERFRDDAPAFAAGMAARAPNIGDRGDSAPVNWVAPLGSTDVHALMILASDTLPDLDDAVLRHIGLLSAEGVKVLFKQEGRARQDQPGHEHFGFKDGVSQPGIRGETAPNPNDPNQGDPGQKLIRPGEFVIGYPEQDGINLPGSDNAGDVSASGPEWTRDGSYLVFRRLRQDVKGFRDFVAAQAEIQQISADLMGAKLVGRYRSGAPLEKIQSLPNVDTGQGDPSGSHAEVLEREHVNDFKFGDDEDGLLVPRAAHIRKTYPRDAQTPGGGEADTQTRRLLRRGIAYGASFVEGSPSDSPHAADVTFPNDRGLLFLCYQSYIEDQFEFVQNAWVNNPGFPRSGDGYDPVISQRDTNRTFTFPGGREEHIQIMQRWVTTTGGEYFFQPSIDALRQLFGAG